MEYLNNHELYKSFIRNHLQKNHLKEVVRINSILIPHKNHSHHVYRYIKHYEINIVEEIKHVNGKFTIFHGNTIFPPEWKWCHSQFLKLVHCKHVNSLGYKNFTYVHELDHLVFYTDNSWEVSDNEISESDNESLNDTEIIERSETVEERGIAVIEELWNNLEADLGAFTIFTQEETKSPAMNEDDESSSNSNETCTHSPSSCTSCAHPILQDDGDDGDDEDEDEDEDEEDPDIYMEIEMEDEEDEIEYDIQK